METPVTPTQPTQESALPLVKELSNLSESQLITRYRSKQLEGITDAPNCFYMPLRVTGTGETLRADANDQVYIDNRLKREFFTPAVIEQCGRLPVTLGHPKDSLVSPETIKEANIIGQTIAAWPDGDEIWALARIYDKSIIEKFGKDINSTSPGVDSGSLGWIEGVNQETPFEINHLAFVDVGHWDQLGSKGFKIDKEDIMILQQTAPVAVTEVDEASVGEVAKEVEALKEHEHQEAKTFEKLAEEHANLDKEEKMPEELVEVKTPDSADVVVEEKPDEEAVTTIDSENTEIEIADEADVEVCDEEKVEVKADEEKTDSDEKADEEKTDSDEKVDEEEIIIDSHETKADAARVEVLKAMRKLCDSAHPSIGVKMPFITDRETARSVITKFAKANLHLVDSKYKNLLNAKLDATSEGLAKDMFKSIQEAVSAKTEKLGLTVKPSGWMDTGRGYSVNPNWLRR